ncbi:hypothetical protein [Agromyces aureus]|uniref:hypothetical protein n=1 Tax=Agromyces aureus TaxID=453304 RepID=UPI0012602B54|nr:hypothetical protein [Agromyces aureus]
MKYVALLVPAVFLLGGIAVIVWRHEVAGFFQNYLTQFGHLGAMTARSSTPGLIALVGSLWIVISVVGFVMALTH